MAKVQNWVGGCVPACGVVLWAAAPENLSVFDPAGSPAASICKFFWLVLAIVGGVFVVVEGLLLYCLVRFRHRDGDTAEPPQLYGSKPLELAWTVAPLLIVFMLFLIVLRSVGEVSLPEPPPGALQVNAVGHQWWFEYEYPELGFRTANELHVPSAADGKARPIFVRLLSADVIHSFWVPRLAGKIDMIPGRTNRMWFQADQDGTFLGQCAEYCGAQHANMMIRIIAEPPAQFEEWQRRQREPARDVPAARPGRDAFLNRSCASCHAIRGTSARGTFGPDLTHLMSRQTLLTGMIANNADNLRAWINDPQRIKPECLMPALRLDGPEVERIVGYLVTLE